jgi:hypothetical protein
VRYPVTADTNNSRAAFRARPSRTWSMREALPRQGFTRCFTQTFHAPEVRDLSVGANCGTMVRSQVRTIGTRPPMRTSTKFAPRFALLVRTLLREAGANPASGCHAGYHGKLPVQAVASRWFPLWFPRYYSGFHWQPDWLQIKPTEPALRACSPFTNVDGRVGSTRANRRAPL